MEHLPLEKEWSEHTVQLGRDIAADDWQSLVSFMREYKDVLAFGPEEMPAMPQL